MKYKKNIIVFIVSLFVFALCGNMPVFADNKPTFGINEIIGSDSNVTTVVSFTPGKAASGSINIRYDVGVLQFVSAEKGSANAQVINIDSDNRGK